MEIQHNELASTESSRGSVASPKSIKKAGILQSRLLNLH
jgi:hypothetical protein